MSACAHRPEPGCLLVPCDRRVLVDGKVEQHTCVCAAEVKAETERVARVPDSARATTEETR